MTKLSWPPVLETRFGPSFEGLGFRVEGLGFRVEGSGFRV